MTITEFISTGCGLDSFNVIYKLTNLSNGKVYIGQTRNSLRKRIISHLSQASSRTKAKKHHLQFAIQNYGSDNFQIEILECCNQDKLNEREIFWIEYFNTTDPSVGYNCTKGGDGCSMKREIKQSTRSKISEANSSKWQDSEYRQRQRDARIAAHKRKVKEIVQLTYSYDIVSIWNYKKDIAEKYGTQIYELRKNRKSVITKGYIWMYLDDYNSIQLPDPVIVQLDNNYNIVNNYYDYKTANIRIHELTGTYGNLQFNTNQKRTRLRGTKKAGFIWMQYSYYKQIISSNENIGYT